MSKLDRSKDAGKGISPRIHDRKWWLPDRPDPWLEAIETVDRRGDKAALIALLKSGEVPTPEQLKHLADLLERHQLTRWQGQQATPSYDVTKDEQQLHRAVKEVRDLVKRRDKSVAEALGQISKSSGIEENKLTNAYGGRRGSYNRLKERLPAFKSKD
jgi:hypothetical protein